MGTSKSRQEPATATSPASSTSRAIALLGDSTIDNIVWVKSQQETVSGKLRAMLPNSIVHNLTADGFTSSEVLSGGLASISWHARRECGDPIPGHDIDTAKRFYPLEQISRVEPKPDLVVISIGGNDIREILGSIWRLQEVVAQLHQNYLEILQRVAKVCPRICIMMQYRPGFSMDKSHYGVYSAIGSSPGPGTSVDKLNSLMQACYAPIVENARSLNLAIIDLPNTFDIHDDDMYISQIEPSAKAGNVIARMIAHVVESHSFEKSLIYTAKSGGSGQIEVGPVPETWQVTLPA